MPFNLVFIVRIYHWQRIRFSLFFCLIVKVKSNQESYSASERSEKIFPNYFSNDKFAPSGMPVIDTSKLPNYSSEVSIF